MGTSLQPEAEHDSESGHRFVLNLTRDANGALMLRNCEITGPEFTNRSSFGKKNSLHETLQQHLADEVIANLSAISDDHQVMSLPEMIVELPGLILAHAHIVVAEMRDGLQNIMLRFRHFVGSLSRAFKNDTGLATSVTAQNEKILTDLLNDISVPLLNLLRTADLGIPVAKEKVGPLFQELAERAHEIEFHIELLKRFSNGQNVPGNSSGRAQLTHESLLHGI